MAPCPEPVAVAALDSDVSAPLSLAIEPASAHDLFEPADVDTHRPADRTATSTATMEHDR